MSKNNRLHTIIHCLFWLEFSKQKQLFFKILLLFFSDWKSKFAQKCFGSYSLIESKGNSHSQHIFSQLSQFPAISAIFCSFSAISIIFLPFCQHSFSFLAFFRMKFENCNKSRPFQKWFSRQDGGTQLLFCINYPFSPNFGKYLAQFTNFGSFCVFFPFVLCWEFWLRKMFPFGQDFSLKPKLCQFFFGPTNSTFLQSAGSQNYKNSSFALFFLEKM